MSATNPQKVKDLIHRFGWDFVARLASLGIQHQAEAQVLFVDSGAANTLDADDTVHGMSFENPLATIDYAIGLCVADEGAIILVAPGYNESLGDAQINFDVAGVTCICLGHGTLRPRVDFDHANASINIGANDVTIINLGLLPAITGVLIGVDVESSVTNFRMAECEFMIGEDGAGDDEFVKAAELKSGNHDCVFENVKILAHASAGGATHGINVAAASNRLTFKNVIIDGPYATGGIVEAAAGVNHVVEDCAVDTTGTNFSFHGSSTFAKRTNNIDGQVTEDESESLLLTTRGTGAYPTGITDESILAYIMGKGATASASSFDNSEHSLEAIGDNVLLIGSPTDVTGAVGTSPTGRSLQDILEKDANGNFDDGTDSLEAIRDHLDGSTILAGINLDHLLKTTTGVVVDGELDQHVTPLSVLGHIMATDADPSSYNCSTDSLQSIAAAVNALSFATAVSQSPNARSLQDILEKDNSGSFDDATDSLEAIRDHLDGTTVLGGIQLDHLAKTVSAGTIYPTEITTDSILGMIMSANGNPSGFNKTTDSLEAISVALAAGTGCDTVLTANQLDTLTGTDTTVAADGDLEDHCVAGSLMAHVLSVSKDATTYKCTTDSLEAISDFVRTGDTLGAGIQLDHLLKTTTGVILDGDLTAYTADLSVMAHLMSATAVGSSFDASTDSLEAIAAALAAGTGCTVAIAADQLDHLVGTTTGVAAGSDLETYCVAGSLMSHVLSITADATAFDARTDSLQAISDKLGAYTFDGGADDEDTVMAHLDLILADTAEIDPAATRIATATTTNWSLSATNKMFTVSGPVKAKIWGVVAATVKAVTMNLKVIGTPTAPGGAIDITDVLDCDADAIGTVYKLNTTLGGAMVAETGGITIDNGIEVILPAGTVTLGSAAAENGDGSIVWYCQYEPLVAGATVIATPP